MEELGVLVGLGKKIGGPGGTRRTEENWEDWEDWEIELREITTPPDLILSPPFTVYQESQEPLV